MSITLDEFNVVRGKDIPACPKFARGWGFVSLSELADYVRLTEEECLERYGPLTKDLNEYEVVFQLILTVTQVDVTGERTLITRTFVPAGWVERVIEAFNHGVRFFEVESYWETRIDEEPIPPHCWNDVLYGNRRFMAFGYCEINGEKVPVSMD